MLTGRMMIGGRAIAAGLLVAGLLVPTVAQAQDPAPLPPPQPVPAPAPPPTAPAPPKPAQVRPLMAPPAPAAPITRAWVGLAFNCTDCGYTTDSTGGRWLFTAPIEIYSVEDGSPAHDAGIRRGDVLTHIADHDITTAEGARRWSALRPGEEVRIRFRRGSESRTTTLRPGAPHPSLRPAPPSPAQVGVLRATAARHDSVAQRLMRQVETALVRQQQQQQALVQQLTETSGASAEVRRQLERAMRTEHDAQREQVRQLLTEQLQLRQESERLVRALTATASITPRAATGPQQLRYSGTFAGADVEVRGLNSVIVTESGGELIITTQDATIRMRVPPRE